MQIITGVTLAMHYTPNIEMAFNSVEHIMMCFINFAIMLKKSLINQPVDPYLRD